MEISNSKQQEVERYQAIKRVTLVGALTNIVLAVLKVVLGYIGQSQALIADGRAQQRQVT